jgi:hypothetical protein
VSRRDEVLALRALADKLEDSAELMTRQAVKLHGLADDCLARAAALEETPA